MNARVWYVPLLVALGLSVSVGCARNREATARGEDQTGATTVGGDPVAVSAENLPQHALTPPPDGAEWAANDALRTVYFNYDSADLLRSAVDTLDEAVSYLKRNPGMYVLVEGHCDERGTSEYNRALGDRRAQSIRGYFAQQGIDPSRVSTVSYGEDRPAKMGHDESAWRYNRRGEFKSWQP